MRGSVGVLGAATLLAVTQAAAAEPARPASAAAEAPAIRELKGAVFDIEGNRLSGVTIVALHGKPLVVVAQTQSAGDGTFRLRIAPGNYNFRLTAPGYVAVGTDRSAISGELFFLLIRTDQVETVTVEEVARPFTARERALLRFNGVPDVYWAYPHFVASISPLGPYPRAYQGAALSDQPPPSGPNLPASRVRGVAAVGADGVVNPVPFEAIASAGNSELLMPADTYPHFDLKRWLKQKW